MTKIQMLLAALFAIFASSLSPSAAHALDNRVSASLISETDRPSPGKTTRIALKLIPQAGWHVYWSNPGDSGMPPQINWSAPAKVRIDDLRHPAPLAKDAAGFVSYVHPGEVSLLADLHIPSSMPAGSPVTLNADVRWLTCSSNMCVPEKAKLSLELTVGTGIGARIDSKQFDAIERELPRHLSSIGNMRSDGTSIEIEFANAVIDVSSARLFPNDQTFDASADQKARREGGKIIFTIASTKPLPSKFSGVITTRGAPRGFAVTARQVKSIPPPPTIHSPQNEIPAAIEYMGPSTVAAPPENRNGASQVPTASNNQPSSINMPVSVPANEIAAWLPSFLAAILGGLLLNLMPCVFPILSLKALSLVRSGSSEAAARIEALSYTAGAVIACTALGAVLLFMRASGNEVGWAFQLQNPYLILGMAALMAAISFNLIGLFELPSISLGGSLMMREGAGGAFWTGALTAFIATPCSGPFMGAAIGAALVLPPAAALAIFFGLGLGLAIPFLAIGTFPALRSKLPKPGAWMVRLRQFLAIPMFLTTIALIWILGRQTGLTGVFVGGFAFAATGAALAWLGRRQATQGRPFAPIATLGMLLLVAVALLPSAQVIARVETSELQRPFSERELEKLVGDGVPVFVDFTADWCLTCKVNEKVGIDTDRTRAALRGGGVVTLIGDWTNGDPEITKFLAKHGRNSIPFYLYYGPGKAPVVLPQLLGPETLADVVKADGPQI